MRMAISAYWSATNSATFASAQSYIPEVVWNESCTAAQCGSANAGIYAGGGGASILFSKPSWQAGVAGIPNDGARDVPDVSLTSASHDFYLLCLDGSCTVKRGQSSFSGVSGTSAATPSFAGIMALVVQYTGARQGQAASNLYGLAATKVLHRAMHRPQPRTAFSTMSRWAITRSLDKPDMARVQRFTRQASATISQQVWVPSTSTIWFWAGTAWHNNSASPHRHRIPFVAKLDGHRTHHVFRLGAG